MRKMKDSGVSWIGYIPREWEMNRTKRYFKVVNGSTPKADKEEYWNGEITWITPAEMDENICYISSSRRTITEIGLNSCGTTLVPSGSIIISNRAPIGQVCLAGIQMCTNQGCKSLVSLKKLDTKFYYYYYLIQTETLNMLGRGTTFLELSSEDLNNYLIPLPKFNEQQSIANYLDQKCEKIDFALKQLENSIEKLKEYKQSLITEAVTKGLDPNVPMKDSGVEWIGEIPEGWETAKLNKVCSIIDGDRGKEYPNDKNIKDEGVPFLSTTCLKGDIVDIGKAKFISEEKFAKLGRGKLQNDDIVISVRGTIGDTAIFIGSEYRTAFINAQMMILRSMKISKYLFYITRSKWWLDLLELLSYGTAQQQLSNSILSTIIISNPQRKEQEEIVHYLDKKCTFIDKAIEQKQSLINKLTEYKKSLIYECVTGKVEV